MNYMVVMNPEWGGVIPGIDLAKAIKRRGDTVVFAGPPSTDLIQRVWGIDWVRAVGFIESKDFDYVPCLTELFASGFLEEFLDSKEPLYSILVRALRQTARASIDELTGVLMERKIDILLLDSFLPFLAVAARQVGIPCVYLRTNLRVAFNSSYPPSWSRVRPTGSWPSRLRVRLEWTRYWVLYTLFTTFGKHGGSIRKLAHDMKQWGEPFGLRVTLSDFGPEYEMPEVVLCPKSFDYPYMRGRNHVGLFDSDRLQEQYPLPFYPEGSKLLYVSLGTATSYFLKYANRFWQLFFRVMEQNPTWYAIVQADEKTLPMQPLPPNAKVEPWVSQIGALGVAQAALVAGGLGTIKECVVREVPFLIFPARHADKPGNAARVEFHGIGHEVDLASVDERSLTQSIEDLLRNRKKFVANMQDIRRELLDDGSADAMFSFLENLVDQSK